MSAYEIKGKLKKTRVNNPSVFQYFDTVANRLIETGQIKNAEVYKDTKRNISHFTNTKDIHFSDIDLLFLNKFEEYLRSNGKGPNTIYVYFRTLRALLNIAIKEEVCAEKYYPFKKFSLAKYANVKTEKRAISKEDIDKIKRVKLEKNKNLVLAHKLFLFSFYCRGMNFVDMAYLRWKDIRSGRMTYTRQKTKELFNLELLDPAKQILRHFKELTYFNKESYVFPIFNENHVSPQTKHNRKVKMLRKINKCTDPL